MHDFLSLRTTVTVSVSLESISVTVSVSKISESAQIPR